MLGETVALAADWVVNIVISEYTLGIVGPIFVLVLASVFLPLRYFFNQHLCVPDSHWRGVPKVYPVTLLLILFLLALSPLSLFLLGWGFPLPIYQEASPDSVLAFPHISPMNLGLNIFCWFPVLVALWLFARILVSPVAGWSLILGASMTMGTPFWPVRILWGPDDGTYVWFINLKGFPVDYFAVNDGLEIFTGYPLLFLTDVALLSLLFSPACWAVLRLRERRAKQHDAEAVVAS